MKVLLNDGMDEEGIKLFNDAGIETDTQKKRSKTLVDAIGDYDALCVRSDTKVKKDVIEAGAKGKLKIIGRAGVGHDNIDIDVASDNGIIVKYAPYGNTNSAAQQAIFLIGAVLRNLPQAHYSLKNGVWSRKQYSGVEITPETILGILGCGRIGQRLSELVRGFDMKVVGYDQAPEFVKSQYPNSRMEYISKEKVLEISDIVSIHIGGNELIVGEKELSLMKPSAYIVNTARGENIDEIALYKALLNGKIAGAGLDVYQNEPSEGEKFENKLRDLGNVVFSPHLGASTPQAQVKTSREIAEVVIGFLRGGNYTKSVNAKDTVQAEEKPVYTLFVHHKDEPGMFAQIDAILKENNINIREINSRQIGKDGAVHTTYLIHSPVTMSLIEQLKALPQVYRALE